MSRYGIVSGHFLFTVIRLSNLLPRLLHGQSHRIQHGPQSIFTLTPVAQSGCTLCAKSSALSARYQLDLLYDARTERLMNSSATTHNGFLTAQCFTQPAVGATACIEDGLIHSIFFNLLQCSRRAEVTAHATADAVVLHLNIRPHGSFSPAMLNLCFRVSHAKTL